MHALRLAVAHQVTNGWRPRLSKTLAKKSPTYTNIVRACWDQDHTKRPTFPKVLQEITKLMRNSDIANDCEVVTATSGSSDGSTGDSSSLTSGTDGTPNSTVTTTDFSSVGSPGGSFSNRNDSRARGFTPPTNEGGTGLSSISEQEVAEFRQARRLSAADKMQIEGELNRLSEGGQSSSPGSSQFGSYDPLAGPQPGQVNSSGSSTGSGSAMGTLRSQATTSSEASSGNGANNYN